MFAIHITLSEWQVTEEPDAVVGPFDSAEAAVLELQADPEWEFIGSDGSPLEGVWRRNDRFASVLRMAPSLTSVAGEHLA